MRSGTQGNEGKALGHGSLPKSLGKKMDSLVSDDLTVRPLFH